MEGGLSTWQGEVGLYSSREGHSCSLFHTLVTLTPWGTVDAGLRHSGSRLPSGQTVKSDNDLVPRKSSADGVLTGFPLPVPSGTQRAGQSHLVPFPGGTQRPGPARSTVSLGPLPSASGGHTPNTRQTLGQALPNGP